MPRVLKGPTANPTPSPRSDPCRIILSERDFARFVECLNNPQPPTQTLIEARRAYRQLQKELPGNNL